MNDAENYFSALFCSLKLYIIHDILDRKSYIMYTRRNKGVRLGGFFPLGLGVFCENHGGKTAARTHELAKTMRFGSYFANYVLH